MTILGVGAGNDTPSPALRGETRSSAGAAVLGPALPCRAYLGARIMTTLIHEMKKRGSRYGLATMCIGVGQGIATVVESIH